MIFDINQNIQPPIGKENHWKLLISAMTDSTIYTPLHDEVVRVVAEAIATNPARPQINSRIAGKEALENIGSEWHALFPRHFPNHPNGADRGLFGMALWHHLATREDKWCFAGIEDPYGFGQNAKQYWRV